MGYNQNKRNYRMSDSELVDFVRVLCQCITRDIVEFGEFSVTAADVTALSNLAIQFNNLPDDEYVHQEYLAAVEEKNIIYEELLSMTKKMATRIELHYGKNSSQYKKFNVSKLIVLNESEFVAQVGLLNQFLESHLAELASEGVTAALLTEYEELIAAFEAQRSVVSDLSIKRKDSTTVRIKKGNEIYDLVSRYCEIGKRIWVGINQTKYNEYVIYGTSGGGLKPPTGLKYLIDVNTAVWDAVENATSYELQYSPDGVNWSDAYGGADNMVYYFPPQEGWAYFRCRARNSNGYGEYSAVLKTGYYQILPPPANIHAKIEENTDNGLILTWDVVPSATSYKIYTSIVPIGEPEGAFAFLSKSTSTKYTQELELGKRYYFQLVALNSAQTSMNSTAVYVDVSGAQPS